MFQIDNQNFGIFVTTLRKEKGLTQKELAEKLFLSDKAVSKWERGLSMPDISLLIPLSEILDVTTTELLQGKRLEPNNIWDTQQVESLVNQTILLSQEEKEQKRKEKGIRVMWYFGCIAVVLLEFFLLRYLNYSWDDIWTNLGLVEFLMLLFGIWFGFLAKETLPRFYDENKISFYSDGFFKMQMIGIYFNNRNWQPILRAARIETMLMFVLFPIFYLCVSYFFPQVWYKGQLFFLLAGGLSVFLPIYIAGRRYK